MALLPLLLALAGDPTPALPDPIGPASQGKAQCYSPDLARKVCGSMTSYAVGADGKIENAASALLMKTPVVLMTTVSPVTITGGRVCGTMRQVDIDTATFTIDGQPADAPRAAELRAAVAKAFVAIVGHVVCVGYEADGSKFLAHTTLDGLPRPDLDQRVIWVAPTDGWKVAP